MIKNELKRATMDLKTWLLLLLGIIIVVSYFLQYTIPFAKGNELLLMHDFPMLCPTSAFEGWIGSGTYSLQSFLYYMILPLLVAGSYVDSLYTEKKSGYLNNIRIRVDIKRYVVGKLLAVFVISGMIFVLPLIVSFLLSMTVLPFRIPQIACASTIIRANALFCDLYYTHPVLYVLIWWGIDFLYAGVVGCVSMLYAFYVEHRFYIYAVPFVVWMFLNAIFGIMHHDDYSPIYLLNPGFGGASGVAMIAFAMILILLLTLEAKLYRKYM